MLSKCRSEDRRGQCPEYFHLKLGSRRSEGDGNASDANEAAKLGVRAADSVGAACIAAANANDVDGRAGQTNETRQVTEDDA